MTTITFDLPEDIAEQARHEGLLTAEALRELLEEATRAAAMYRLGELWRATPAALQDAPPLPEDDLRAIVRAARARRAA
jgi:predicted anti-sigma-YlaC factor YlaD